MKSATSALGVIAVCLLVLAGAVRQADSRTGVKLPDFGDPKPVYLVAKLAPSFANHAYGSAVYMAKEVGDSYRLDVELVIPFSDFKALDIDASNGLDDESIVVRLGKYEMKMTYSHVDPTGAAFTLTETGSGLVVQAGDDVAITANGKDAAAGKF